MNSFPTEYSPRTARLCGIVLFAICVVMFGLMSYGGVRSPDSEVVFRVAESLAQKGSFALEGDLEDWPEFGVAYGRGAKLYAIFGPLESIILAPIVKVGDLINETGWYKPLAPKLPVSQMVQGGLINYIMNEPPKDPRPHALRMLAAFYNVIISALGVFVFWKILLLLTRSIPASFLVSLIYALGTLAWSYAGTFFSEPLATLLVLSSFFYMVRSDGDHVGAVGLRRYRSVFLSGIWMGLAITSHITAILFAPFFAWYLFLQRDADPSTLLNRTERLSVFVLGVSILMFLLGWYNYARFGNFFETGRSVSVFGGENLGYGTFVLPFVGLFGLIFGAGKGLAFFSPALIIGAFLWKDFLRGHKKLFWAIAAAVLFRILFIASRSDWHAGFCMGPRYLVMIIPFFLIPLAFWLKRQEPTRFDAAFGLVSVLGFLVAVEQLFFCLMEPFSFLHLLKWRSLEVGVDVFQNSALYLDWQYSPFLYVGQMRISPFLLRFSGLTLGQLMLVGTGVLLFLFTMMHLAMRRLPRASRAESASQTLVR